MKKTCADCLARGEHAATVSLLSRDKCGVMDKQQRNPRRRWTRDPGLGVRATVVHWQHFISTPLTECKIMTDDLETNLLDIVSRCSWSYYFYCH